MKIYFSNSLCHKCPYNKETEPCNYKKVFYQNAPKKKGRIKLVHRCAYYRKIFNKGQLVVVDLYNRVRLGEKNWKYKLVRKNVLGFIVGRRGNKFRIELFDPVYLIIRKGGKPQYEKDRCFLQCSKPAIEIRPFSFCRDSLKTLKIYNIREESPDSALN